MWKQSFLSRDWHSTKWAIGELTVRYKVLRFMNCGKWLETQGTIDYSLFFRGGRANRRSDFQKYYRNDFLICLFGDHWGNLRRISDILLTLPQFSRVLQDLMCEIIAFYKPWVHKFPNLFYDWFSNLDRYSDHGQHLGHFNIWWHGCMVGGGGDLGKTSVWGFKKHCI